MEGQVIFHELPEGNFVVQCSADVPPLSIAWWCRDSEVLGSKNDDDGESWTAVQAQLLKAQLSFPREKKFRHYIKFVVPVALHGCGCWTEKLAFLKALSGFEARCVKRMVGLKKKADMTWVQWRRQSVHLDSNAMSSLQHKTLTVRFRERFEQICPWSFLLQGLRANFNCKKFSHGSPQPIGQPLLPFLSP